jgi:glycosyltransferase involved in cell wall biosynthesis
VDVDRLRPAPKLPLILSVGRFFRSGHSKRQDALVEAVRALGPDLAGGWSVVLAGGTGHNPSDRRYFQEVEAAARGLPVTLWPNVPAEALAELYAHAAVYWHAAGFGRDEHTDPARMEHFGITTVEAMAAGCVPLVYDAGGQAEIVAPGVDGYRWRSLGELVELTRTVIADPSLRARLARAATRNARRFGRDLFDVRVTGLVEEMLGTRLSYPADADGPLPPEHYGAFADASDDARSARRAALT